MMELVAVLMAGFPAWFKVDIGIYVDQAVQYLTEHGAWFFNGVNTNLLGFLNGLQVLLDFIPWWVLVLLIFALGWRSTGKVQKGLLYALMLMFVGALGLWTALIQTLSIVIASVLISVVIGLPIGLFSANAKKFTAVIRPVLDAMQTMPTFVYLIPAVMFFGLGKVPAVIATTIYAVPPVIRLASHAIQQVEPEVVEAGRAFGATYFQLLFKVQIPQALPTIMEGINQTMMMAVSMIVTCSMIGAKGLGQEVITAINRLEIGRGFTSGISIVILAILIDRLTQGWYRKSNLRSKGVN